MKNEIKVSEKAKLPTRHGDFIIQSFKEGEQEHLAIYTESMPETPLVRVHSECLTGDVLGSNKCDCGAQLDAAMKLIHKEGGMVIYHRQEGRNIGLFNKVNAYALQDQGLNTVEANLKLGFKADERTYDVVDFILEYFGIKEIKLITNNPSKISSLKSAKIVERVPLITNPTEQNEGYLKVKKEQMGHLL
jgi:GTP cyclohydrolase II